MFVTRRKVCILWKLEGDINVSDGAIPSEFEWWDTTCAREHGMRLKEAVIYMFVTFGVFEVCNAYCGTSKSGVR